VNPRNCPKTQNKKSGPKPQKNDTHNMIFQGPIIINNNININHVNSANSNKRKLSVQNANLNNELINSGVLSSPNISNTKEDGAGKARDDQKYHKFTTFEQNSSINNLVITGVVNDNSKTKDTNIVTNSNVGGFTGGGGSSKTKGKFIIKDTNKPKSNKEKGRK
jgi:hypothetical protein